VSTFDSIRLCAVVFVQCQFVSKSFISFLVNRVPKTRLVFVHNSTKECHLVLHLAAVVHVEKLLKKTENNNRQNGRHR
jgi:hypothetical protein